MLVLPDIAHDRRTRISEAAAKRRVLTMEPSHEPPLSAPRVEHVVSVLVISRKRTLAPWSRRKPAGAGPYVSHAVTAMLTEAGLRKTLLLVLRAEVARHTLSERTRYPGTRRVRGEPACR